MKLCRFDDERLGLIDGGAVRDVSEVLSTLPASPYRQAREDAFIAHLETLRPRIEAAAARAPTIDTAAVTLLSPVANPTKIVCAPVNYLPHLAEAREDAALHQRQHVAKIHEVALFLKATSALVGPGEGIRLRHLDRRNDHELELAVIIGRHADRVTREQALSRVAGYTIGLDMTLRGTEDRSFRKSIDSYAVLGPWLVTADELGDASALEMSLAVNGELRQRANTRDLVVDIPALIAWASSFYTLHPGDVILTGTPAGVGPVVPGDRIEASIQSIGSMTVLVGEA